MFTDVIAHLTSENTIQVTIKNRYPNFDNRTFSLICNGEYLEVLKCLSKSKNQNSCVYIFLTSKEILINNNYELKDDTNEYFPLDISFLTAKNNFDSKYCYDGQLGNIYTKERTTFRAFSPLVSEILLKITLNGKTCIYFMKKQENGIFEITLEGDYDRAKYVYMVKHMGEYTETCDPYCFSCDANSRHSYVVDLNKVKEIDSHLDKLPKIEHYVDHIIYEMSVRDMTSLTNIPIKGTFSALTMDNLKDYNNTPIGFDYIKSLGITTVQLGPVYDFQTIDEEHPFRNYNWGYDPKLFFVPEGSYSTNPNDPYSRIIEFKKMVSKFHENGIRVVMDVVYNHVYSVGSNPLELLCPQYYFRKNLDGSYSNGSGCGNDFESRTYMGRKLIIDSLLYFTNVYGIDGYRFDLMGILDINTVNLAYKKLKEVRDDIICYGEGWDMNTNLPYNQKAASFNSRELNNIGFFNDRFRDIAKGKSSDSELGVKGYLTYDTNYIDGFKHVFAGSVLPLSYPPLFDDPNQSINYVECHDNSTLFDKLRVCSPDDSYEDRKKRINMINACCMFSCGVPFFHMGQEVGLSKKGIGNSYNSGDEINGMNYQEVFKNKDMYEFFKELVSFRKRAKCFKLYNKQDIMDKISFQNLEKGALLIKYTFPDKEYYIIFNPSKEMFTYTFDNYVKVLFNNSGVVADGYDFFSQTYLVNGLSVSVLYREL